MNRPPYTTEDPLFDNARYRGSCYCGAVKLLAKADPVDAKICHCRGCQLLHGAPMQWAAIFHKHDILFTKDSIENITFFNSESMQSTHVLPCKLACKNCRGLIADEGRRMMLLFPTVFNFDRNRIPESFKPTCHIFYGQRVVDVRDGVPKFDGHKDQSKILEE
jgi:hypothetical protein